VPAATRLAGAVASRLRNPCLAPFRPVGPYHCILLVPGVLDTKGGPRIDRDARAIGLDGSPIPGLYGAGNCIASPAGAGYWGGERGGSVAATARVTTRDGPYPGSAMAWTPPSPPQTTTCRSSG
jgi:predicted oxidoreductase